jgi:hypothetical protein
VRSILQKVAAGVLEKTMIRRLLHMLPFSPPYLYPLEHAVIDGLVGCLPKHFRDLCRKQINLINTVQRGGPWDMLLIGRFRFRRSRMPANILLPVGSGDVKLSRVFFEINGENFNAVLHSQDGALFTINFGQSYKHVKNNVPRKFSKMVSLVKS